MNIGQRSQQNFNPQAEKTKQELLRDSLAEQISQKKERIQKEKDEEASRQKLLKRKIRKDRAELTKKYQERDQETERQVSK